MKTILICNSKGGVGKSLIADELAFSFERSGRAYNFYDLDAQGGTLHKTTKVENAIISIVDTPGALQSELTNWMKEANLIILPTRATSRDIEPLCRMMEAVKANASGRVLYVINCWTRYKAARDFQEWLQGQIGANPILILPQSEMFVQAGAYGESIVRYAPQSTAAKATVRLCNTVLEILEE